MPVKDGVMCGGRTTVELERLGRLLHPVVLWILALGETAMTAVKSHLH